MNTPSTTQQSFNPASLLYLVLGLLFSANLFVYCWLIPPVPESLIARRIIFAIHEALTKPDMMRFIEWAKYLIAGMQIAIVFADPPRFNSGRGNYKKPLILSALGSLLFFGSDIWRDAGGNSELRYPVCSLLGYFMLMPGLYGLYRAAFDPFNGLFAKERVKPGFRQTEKVIGTAHAVHLRGRYLLNGRRRETVINFVNPRRGILIMGTPGAGKSRFVIEPLIRQVIEKSNALFIYDIKYPELTFFAYSHFLANKEKYPACTRFICINFADLSRSHRCNPIDCTTIEHASDAIGISRTLLYSINKTWSGRQGDFFVESPISFVAVLIWFLRNFEGGRYCTLPHVIELAKTPYEELFTILNASTATRGMAAKFVELFRNKTMETLDGQITSARIPLDLLDSPDFYYVLSGNNVDLDINNPERPAICCLASYSRRQEALTPVLSLLIDRLNREINVAGKYPCTLVFDEFATVRATSVLNTIATGRSNNVSTIIAVQDINQLRSIYTQAEANQALNTPGNLICGQVTGETARWVKERFDSVIEYRTTVSINSSDTSISRSEQSKESITTADLASLSSGEFVGIIADDPDAKLAIKDFHALLSKDPEDELEPIKLPITSPVDQDLLEQNANRIRTEITDLVAKETKRVINDPALKKFSVKR